MNISFSGFLGGDPVMRFMPDGTEVVNFSVAEDTSYKNKAGEKVSRTTWFRCTVWGKAANVINEYFKKGRGIVVEVSELTPGPDGTPRTFTRQDGSVGASYDVRVLKWKFPPVAKNDNGVSDTPDYGDSSDSTEKDDTPSISFL